MAGRPDALAAGPLNIYEVHLGSWRRAPDGSCLNYRDIARQLGPYLRQMGYNAVELLPVMEHPLDESWGYQVTGFFSVTSRYGTPADFKFLVDTLHGLGIRVILDWVPAHFPRDSHGLACFDGAALFEYADRRIGEQPEWGTLVFDYGKSEVRSFLISSAWFWLQEMHADGLRFDAVSSMLYRDYGRADFLPNADGGKENYEAIAFLRQLNGLVREKLPSCLLIAEESTAWSKVSHPVSYGGLGFTHKWDMGWMHDTLDYLVRDFGDRGCHHNQLSFSMFYAFSERFILPLSHDEVVHGKRSLIGRMPGDIWRQAAGLRAFYLYQMTHPGGKLLFMGSEFGQFVEWRFGQELEWFLLENAHHRQLQDFVAALNHYYLAQPALWQTDTSWDGFAWIVADDAANSVYTYLRRAAPDPQEAGRQPAPEECRVVILNLSPEPRLAYRLGVPFPGPYRIDVNSDDRAFGGSGYPPEPRLVPGQADAAALNAEPWPSHGQPASLILNLPPLCGLILRPEPKSSETGAAAAVSKNGKE
jgi:1,4-alpha-glucan branching enzyme